jgi:agmatinase
MKKERNKNPVQPVSGTKVPRFAGPSTFARLPELRDVESCDVAIVGIPFDAGTSYRPGARFGPMSIRQASRHLRTNYHPSYDVEPFKVQQVADAGDITCNPFNIDEAIKQIEEGATELLDKVGGIISLGGDHTIALPLLRAINKMNNGPVALVHFDAHLDTWDTYFGAPYTHGTPFRRAREENLFLDDHCDEFQTQGTDKIAERIRKRVGNNPLYLSIDIDVLDPAFAPGTGTPEIAGMTTREMVNVIRGLSGLNLISADVVEVSPAYDHAEVTSLAAATIVYELTNLFAKVKR